METLSSDNSKLITKASQLITNAQHGIALTGAGMSTSSGIPDFRSEGSGLWTRYNPLEVASLSAFRYHPERFFEWLRPLASHMLNAQPNSGHTSLAKLEKAGYLKTIITQNIDTLHQQAGSNNVLEVHGTFKTLTCTGCHQQIQANQGIMSQLIEKGIIPRCNECGKILKPNVVLFEEQLPAQVWNQARKAINSCDLMLVLGSSLTVTPVSNLPQEAYHHGAALIMINQTETHLDPQAEVVVHNNLATILPLITEKVIHA